MKNQVTILIIDDDKTIQDLLKRQLKREGFQVAAAYSGEEGLRQARDIQPHVIALDIMMPRMDGWEVLHKIQDDETIAHIPVVIISMLDDKPMGLALGAADYLRKPIERAKLIDVLKRHMLAATGNAHILIVEDDVDTRDLFLRTAQREGWQTHAAENGVMGLERIKQQKPDLILLDLMMPEMDGFTFLSELRKHPDWQAIPVIVVTAKTLTAEDTRILQQRTQKILQKGDNTPQDVIAEIRRVLPQQKPT